MGQALVKADSYRYADYLDWPEGERFELIDGTAYAMAPAPLRVHQELLGAIYREVATHLDGKPCRPFVAPFDVRLPQADENDEDIDTVVQPDMVVVCDRSKLDERGCRGAPDWVMEVLSPSTTLYDLTTKRDLYERVGVREYWLVHPADRIVTVHLLQDGRYGAPHVHGMSGRLAVRILPEVIINWVQVLRNVG